MSETTVILNLDDEHQKDRFLTHVGALNGEYQFVFKPWKPRRSNRDNAGYWAGIVTALVAYGRAQGDEMTKDEAHDILKRECLGMREIINKKTGEVAAKVPKSSATLSEDEFYEYTLRCLAWLGQMGVIVPRLKPTAAMKGATA